MRLNTRSVVQWMATQLGSCPKCMRSAFFAAMLGLCLAMLASLFAPTLPGVWLLWPLAGALVGLWLLHLVVYALRVARSGAGGGSALAGPDEAISPPPLPDLAGRRAFLVSAMKAFGFAFLATSFSFGRSRADSSCQITSCSDPKCVCVAPTPRCVFCPNRNEFACAPSGVTICCSNEAFWSCQSPTPNCYGNGASLPRCH